ncbi:DDE Tnp4 domain-containing protein [Aphis craccivora]|uniref:DDE Tnp4 domain-containing protein n=1 Tax=Aphis craccivora TaxID=307492 RepID=A0A6G0YIB2_APHCR|nr:DDE Tnp4 domain-containing protein [Aphis craccivora]
MYEPYERFEGKFRRHRLTDSLTTAVYVIKHKLLIMINFWYSHTLFLIGPPPNDVKMNPYTVEATSNILLKSAIQTAIHTSKHRGTVSQVGPVIGVIELNDHSRRQLSKQKLLIFIYLLYIFETTWNYPNCIGSMDGKHVVLQSPMNSGTEYFNYKSCFSIVLFALVDADYNFLFVDIGCQRLPLPGKNVDIPFVILADGAFALTNLIMKPRARRTVENAFGISSAVFRVLRKPLLLEPQKAQIVVMAVVYLHNFLRHSKSSRNIYTSPGSFDKEEEGRMILGDWREFENTSTSLLPLRNVARRPPLQEQEIREHFADYFLTNGSVQWQNM